ncbi:RHS repeat domain-containing protein, partial [Candidatus Albibeggiatoa sp. nov. NOAA]|uniref:RHS repeat domain-containing protein n=1 Tax=Candidatus Albibeggiatoa sp. nov. NOAA TaxID=3162724 RepID=UPI0032FC3977|nr:RHS repeat protein [Thiotrichaceae bacterium]
MDENRTPNADNEYTNSDFGYDAVGNLTTYADKQFRYDWANRLIEVSDNSGIVASYTYDALNRRITKYVVADDTTTSYIYFGSQVLEELENGTFKRRYIYGSYVDEPLSMYDADTNQTYTYLRDRQFSVVGLVDEQGDVVESYRYSSFG